MGFLVSTQNEIVPVASIWTQLANHRPWKALQSFLMVWFVLGENED